MMRTAQGIIDALYPMVSSWVGGDPSSAIHVSILHAWCIAWRVKLWLDPAGESRELTSLIVLVVNLETLGDHLLTRIRRERQDNRRADLSALSSAVLEIAAIGGGEESDAKLLAAFVFLQGSEGTQTAWHA